jgi:hypothetical protein
LSATAQAAASSAASWVRRAAVWLLWSGAESAEAPHMPVRDECLGCGQPEAPAVAGHHVGTCQPV